MAQDETIDATKFHTGIIGNPPTALVIQIPIQAYADQGPDGLDMFYGKMKRMEAVGSNMIRAAWEREKKNGLVKPLGVH